MILPSFDRDAARTLIKEKADAPFSAFDTSVRAHRRQDLQQHAEAALLFCLATERANAEHRANPSKPNQAMNYLVRAGIAFNRAAETETAEPLLRQAIAFDWAGQGLPHDKHMVEWAFFQLLVNARNDKDRFARLFDEAVSRCAEVGRDYTVIHPHQEELLEIAMGMKHRPGVERLAGKIADRRPAERPRSCWRGPRHSSRTAHDRKTSRSNDQGIHGPAPGADPGTGGVRVGGSVRAGAQDRGRKRPGRPVRSGDGAGHQPQWPIPTPHLAEG